MAGKRPDGKVFASGAAEGEVLDFPSIERGWGVTLDGNDPNGKSVTDATDGIPPMEWDNALLQRIDGNILWLLQNALPDWAAGTWPVKSVVVNNDIVYRAVKETAVEPTASAGDWIALFPLVALDERYAQVSKNLGDLADVGEAKINLKLDKVGNYAAVQSGGGVHAGDEVHRINIDWGDGDKLYATVDDTDQGEIFTTKNPPTASQTDALPTKGGDLTGVVTTSDEIRSTHDNNFRMVNGDRGIFWRLDANNLYLMKTASGDQYGSYDESRPMRVDLTSGTVYINDAQPYSSNNCPFPVGYVMLMGNSSDPNGLYPGTAWQFLNGTGYDGRVIALGQDPLAIGGSNTVTLTAEQMPPHRHKGGSTGDAAIKPDDGANQWGTGRFGTDNKGGEALMETSATGGGQPFSVQNEFVHFIGWMRIA